MEELKIRRVPYVHEHVRYGNHTKIPYKVI